MAPLSIESLLALQFPRTLSLSPSAQQVLYATSLGSFGHKTADAEWRSTLWLASVGVKHSARALTDGSHNDRAPCWAPDGQRVAFVSDRGGKADAKKGTDAKCAVYVLTLEGEEVEAVTDEGWESEVRGLRFSPDGRFLAFLSADEKTEERKERDEKKDDADVYGEEWAFQRLRVVDLETKKVKTLVERDAHVVEFAWAPESDRLAFAAFETPDIEEQYESGTRFAVVDLEGSVKKLSVFPNSAKSLVWSSEQLYFIGPVREGETAVSANKIFTISLQDGGDSQYAAHAGGDEDCPWDIQNASSADAVYQVQSGVSDHLRMLDTNRTIFKQDREITDWAAGFSKDSDEVVLALNVSDVNTPNEVYSTTASGGALVPLSNHGADLAATSLGTNTFLNIRSFDDQVSLDGLFISPGTAKSDTPVSTITMIHGGPYSRSALRYDSYYFSWAPYLLSRGYAILLTNYRGTSGRGEAFAAYAHACGGKEYEDVIALTNAAVKQGLADPKRLMVGGWSQGGFLSYLSASRNGSHGLGWKYQGAIPGAGISDQDVMSLTSDIGSLEGDFAGGAPWKVGRNDTKGRLGSSLYGFCEGVEDAQKKRTIYDFAHKDDIPPLLILHGANDLRVPLEQAVGMRRAMRAAGLGDRVQMVSYPREGHIILEYYHLTDMARRVGEFVEKCLGKGDV